MTKNEDGVIQEKKTAAKHNILSKFLRISLWIFGCGFVINAFDAWFSRHLFLLGIFNLLIACFLLPPIARKIEGILPYKSSIRNRSITIFVLIILGALSVPDSKQKIGSEATKSTSKEKASRTEANSSIKVASSEPPRAENKQNKITQSKFEEYISSLKMRVRKEHDAVKGEFDRTISQNLLSLENELSSIEKRINESKAIINSTSNQFKKEKLTTEIVSLKNREHELSLKLKGLLSQKPVNPDLSFVEQYLRKVKSDKVFAENWRGELKSISVDGDKKHFRAIISHKENSYSFVGDIPLELPIASLRWVSIGDNVDFSAIISGAVESSEHLLENLIWLGKLTGIKNKISEEIENEIRSAQEQALQIVETISNNFSFGKYDSQSEFMKNMMQLQSIENEDYFSKFLNTKMGELNDIITSKTIRGNPLYHEIVINDFKQSIQQFEQLVKMIIERPIIQNWTGQIVGIGEDKVKKIDDVVKVDKKIDYLKTSQNLGLFLGGMILDKVPWGSPDVQYKKEVSREKVVKTISRPYITIVNGEFLWKCYSENKILLSEFEVGENVQFSGKLIGYDPGQNTFLIDLSNAVKAER